MSLSAASDLFRQLDRELWLVTARDDGRRGGLILTSVAGASIAPEAPRVSVAIAKSHATWGLMEASSAFMLHLLTPDQLSLVERFGMHSSRDVDKFADGAWSDESSGGPRLVGAAGWLDCRVEARLDTGDRTIYLAAVTDAAAPAAGASLLTLHQFFKLAPQEWLQRHRAQFDVDAAHDALAIAAWRAEKGLSTI